MNKKIVAGGVIEKDNKFLLIKESKEICKGKWNIPAGTVEEGENVIETAKREIFEETGCKVEINGILEIVSKQMENTDIVGFFFETTLIDENIKIDGNEIIDIKWFSYEEILNMKDNLRADGYFLSIIKNKIEKKTYPIELIHIE